MKRMSSGTLSGLFGLTLAVTAIGRMNAQETQTAPSAAPQIVVSDASQPVTTQARPDQPTENKNATPVPTPVPSAALVVKGKKKDEVYTGPTTLVVLPPTPMLDEEGMQRQDPDGKLMFNPPVKQQRDKKGHPLFDADNKPVMQTKDELGYDENGKKLHPSKVKPPKTVAVSISRGTLTVDGMTGKAALNYEIKDLKYIYFYVPGIGTTVVSNDPFPGAVEQKHAFDDKTLTVTVNEHMLQLSSDNRMLGKAPQSAYVLVDKSFAIPTKFPMMGYGPIRVAPYAWPGSKSNEELKGAVAVPPPLPTNLRPTLALQPCPAGQMRTGEQSAQGEAHPCVPIVRGETAASSANQVAASTGNTRTQN
jgi:hypothetical protein